MGVWRLVEEIDLYSHHKASSTTTPFRSMLQRPRSLPLGGFRSWLRRRTTYLENYQPALASVLAASFLQPELPEFWEHAMAVDEQRACISQLGAAHDRDQQEAVRTVQRPTSEPWPSIHRVAGGDSGVKRS